MTRVVVVDDSAFMRRAITQMLTSDGDIEVVGSARNGREGLELVKNLKPDVVTLDVEMPEMDGLTALRHIMRQCPTQVLMVSSLTTDGSVAALRAMQLGAADVLAKDTSQVSLGIMRLQDELLARVRALAASRFRRWAKPLPQAEVPESLNLRPGQFDAICIGASTGGPPVLETVLSVLPGELKTPVVVAQHMPAIFTASMAERLAECCKMRVLHADKTMPLELHTIYIARGEVHLRVMKKGLARYEVMCTDEPREALYHPSVDVLFQSAAEAMGSRVLGVVLTGMGCDGLEGGKVLHARGGVLLAQSEETCVVYGMPKAVTENGLVSASLSPRDLGRVLANLALPGVKAAAKSTPTERTAGGA